MKTRRAIGMSLLILMFPACGGYYAISKQADQYEPGGLYRAEIETPDTEGENRGETSMPADSALPETDRFDEETARLDEKTIQWQRSIDSAEYGGAFLRPDPTLRDRLKKIARNDEQTRAAVTDTFGLDELRTLVLYRHPGIHAAEEQFRGTLERYSQAANLDEILRQYSAFTEGLMTGVGPMKGREPVRMNFPFPGMIALKGEIITAEVTAARETLEAMRRDAVTMATKAYWNLLFMRKAETITREMLGLLEYIEAVAKTRYEAGKTSFQDVIKVRIKRETVTEDLQTIMERQENLRTRLREFLHLPPSAKIGNPVQHEIERSVPNLAGLSDWALKRRQELRGLRARALKMERMIEMAETRIYPDFDLNLSHFQADEINRTGTSAMKEPFAVQTAASRGAGLPLRSWYGTNNAYIRETRKNLAGLRSMIRKTEDTALRAVRDAWFDLDLAVREERLFGDSIVDLSQAALEVSTSGYEAGNVMFGDVIASYTNWLKANLALERRKADVGVARAGLEAAVGTSPIPGSVEKRDIPF